MKGKTGDGLQLFFAPNIGRNLGMVSQNIQQVISPLFAHEEGERLVASCQGPANDLGGLSQVDTPLGLLDRPQLHIRQLGVVAHLVSRHLGSRVGVRQVLDASAAFG